MNGREGTHGFLYHDLYRRAEVAPTHFIVSLVVASPYLPYHI
jgi:hypothetical protein